MIIKQDNDKIAKMAIKVYMCEAKWKQEFRSVTAKPIQAKIIKQPAGFSEAY